MASRIDIDTDSPTWRTLREWAETKLTDCRKRNDAMLPEHDTAVLRGQIHMLKDLLSLEIKSSAEALDAFGRAQRRDNDD